MPSVVGQITKGAVFAALVGMADVGNNKWDATAAPGAGDDSADGYIVGSIWADTTHHTVYVCTDNAAGAAVWVQILTGGGAGATGAAGMPGMDGADGLDGFPIPGPVGATGAAGAGGAVGPAGVGLLGPPGMDGEDGLDGFPIPGATGAGGATGATGAEGRMGYPGFDGADGLDGFPIPGTAGAEGAAGAAGAPGASIIGPMGMPGFDGADGLDGFPIPGPPGATGATGAAGSGGGSMGPPGMDGEDGQDAFGWPLPHGTPTSHDRRITCAVYLTPVSDTVPKWISPPLPLSTIISAEIKSYDACGATAQVIDIHKQTAANKNSNTAATIWSTHANCLALANTQYQAETTTFDVTAIAEGDRLYVFSHVLGTGLTVAYITVTIRPT